MKEHILKKIFREHFEEIQYILHPRPVVMENVEKMVNCGDPSFGGAMYGCPCCGELKFVPFRCHSKFCPTCGNKYCLDRSTKMSFKLIRCTHRHLVFTIDEDLRPFFLEDRSRLDCLFQTVLLNLMESRIGDSFKKTKSLIYKKDKDGFYVYAKPNLCDPDTVVKYISRYLGRPVIAASRIDSYDGENVTFHYNKHEDDSLVQKTIPVLDFIKLLIQHIPEKHFKMTRYYGLYARHREIDDSLHKAVARSKHRTILDFNTWRKLILLSFGYDPLQCPRCNHKMEFLELYHNHKPVPLQELYERTMAKAKCRSS